MIDGNRIKVERIKRGMSQAELGKVINVSKVAICGYEKGTKTPTMENYEEILKTFDLEPNELLIDYIEKESKDFNEITNEDLVLLNNIKLNKKLYTKLCKNIDNLDKIDIVGDKD